MAPELVNPIPSHEIAAWLRSLGRTFQRDPDGPGSEAREARIRSRWDPERAWGVSDRGRWVATLATEPRQMTVPGSERGAPDVVVDAVTAVTVAATHRRRGLMGRMLTDSLRSARERREPISALIAAEWPIYGRFGYAPAAFSADYELLRSRPGARCEGDPSRLRQLERDELGEIAPALYAAARVERAGQLDRPSWWWEQVLGLDGYGAREGAPVNWLVHEGEQGPDGLVGWSPGKGGFAGLLPPLGTVEAHLATAAEDAYRDIWAYLTGLDGVDTVRLGGRPVDERARWLLGDGRMLVMRSQTDFLWLRLLDVPAALVARRYALAGEVKLEVIDLEGDRFAAGRYALEIDAQGRACCEPTAAPAEVEITQRALAAAYLGGVRLAQLAPGAARELAPGALARLELMLSTPLAPWNATWF
jgi:predicted acetyltransferase